MNGNTRRRSGGSWAAVMRNNWTSAAKRWPSAAKCSTTPHGNCVRLRGCSSRRKPTMLTLADGYRRLGELPRSPFTVADYRQHLFAQYRAHEITYEIRTVMPDGASAFAVWGRNHV